MSPYQIEILLHYHYSPQDHPQFWKPAPIWRETVEGFICDGLMESDPEDATRHYRLTAKGHFYVSEGLCKVPLPEQIFIIPK